MRVARVRFTVWRFMLAVTLFGALLVLLRLPTLLVVLAVVGSCVCGAILFGIRYDRDRGGYGIKGGVAAACCSSLALLAFIGATYHWSGAAPVTITFKVVDGTTGIPVSGAGVELFDPDDIGPPPVSGKTTRDGRVKLRRMFHAGGMVYGGVIEASYVSFRFVAVRVVAPGYREYQALLAESGDLQYQGMTDPPLGILYPVSADARIRLTRSTTVPPPAR